ncbi:MAG: M3 family metallopeptidase [Gammaproteobacteria bacterium]|nr:M3 family metallopeptidase [Gammaproteobacteria bacterium]
MDTNPLLDDRPLPSFARIEPAHAAPAINQLLGEIKAQTEILLSGPAPGWTSALVPIEALDDRLNRAWSPISHLHNVADTEELRAAYNACLPLLTAYATDKYQSEPLYRTYRRVRDGEEYGRLGAAERRIIDNALRDFRLSGIELPPGGRARFKELKQTLARLQTKFEENVLDATHAWKRHLTDAAELNGLPESALALARQTAQREGMDGWMLTLDIPCYRPVMAYCGNRELREEMYRAHVTRASELGTGAGRFDNHAVMEEILQSRRALAQLLGFENFAEYSLATKMAKSTTEVIGFLEDLAQRAKPVAEKELRELRDFASERYQARDLQAWDIPYFSERLREARYRVSQEELRPYFPLPRVLEGLFAITRRLYGMRIEPAEAETWHPDVRFFRISDENGNVRGMFYLDLYARPLKRGGAWMDDCVSRRRRTDGSVQIPVAYLNGNFSPPVSESPSLLTHEEVLTLFHEFGHGLHHMLTCVERPGVAGINGVAWDAVEVPSQFMENWCWERAALELLSGHFQTGAPLDSSLLERLRAARNFQAGMQMVRQLEFALFDFRLHIECEPSRGRTIEAIVEEVRRDVAVIRPPAFNRFQNSFTHIFAGGYAAGYYSYKWAEVLSADAYSKFEERGIFDMQTGREFLHHILEMGGTLDAMDLFMRFRGRPPQVDALLRHSGIA